MRFPTYLPVAPLDMEATVGGSLGVPTGSKLRDRKGQREEPREMETEVRTNTRDRDKTGTSPRRKRHRELVG